MPNAQVLIVEDESVAARHIQKALTSLGYRAPTVVDNGPEAVEAAEKHRPDLVLMDVVLKGPMDGVEAAGRINDRLDIPVVYLTASADMETLERAKATQPFGYITKPFENKVLHTTLEIALYKHEIESRLRSKSEELEALYSVARILAQPWSFEQKTKGVLEALTGIARADLTTMRVYDQGDDGMHLVSRAGKAGWDRPECVPVEGTVSGLAFKSREPVVISDYTLADGVDQQLVARGIRSSVAVPIKADRWTLGVVNLVSTEPNHFPPKLVNLLSGIADGLAVL